MGKKQQEKLAEKLGVRAEKYRAAFRAPTTLKEREAEEKQEKRRNLETVMQFEKDRQQENREAAEKSRAREALEEAYRGEKEALEEAGGQDVKDKMREIREKMKARIQFLDDQAIRR